MLEAWGLLVLGLAGLALAVLAEHRSRQLKYTESTCQRAATLHKEAEARAAYFETLLAKSMAERVDLTGRLTTAEDLKGSYEQAALMTLQRMDKARQALRRPRTTDASRIRKALACLEPRSEQHVTLTKVFRTAEEDARLNALPTMRGKARK